MEFHQPPHISFGFVGDCTVVLDAAADRYFRLAERETATLAALAGGRGNDVDALVAGGLANRGLIKSGPGRPIAPIEITEPAESAIELRGPRETVGALEAGYAIAAARLSLRFAGLASTIARWRCVQAQAAHRDFECPHMSRASGRNKAAAVARGFADARMYVPVTRRCVPDSMALATCLWRRGGAAELYFGVRLAPFAAHCWVQTGDLLLSDPFDIVREFTPVFKL